MTGRGAVNRVFPPDPSTPPLLRSAKQSARGRSGFRPIPRPSASGSCSSGAWPSDPEPQRGTGVGGGATGLPVGLHEQLLPPEWATLMAIRPLRARSRWHAVRCALQGWRDAWTTQPNLRIHVVIGLAVIAFSAWLRLAPIEWLWISFAVGLVIFAELMNTAIEQTVDLVVGPRPDPLARQVKDIAAGFVLIAAVIAVVIGVLTLGPHLLAG